MTVEELVHDLVGRAALTGATLSKPSRNDPARARRVTIRPVLLHGELRYGWTYHETAQATRENLSADETERRLVHVLGGEFRRGLLHAEDADFQVLGGAKVLRRPPTVRRRRWSTIVGSATCSRKAFPCRFSSSSA